MTHELGKLPEDALRRQAFVILSRLQSGTEDVVCLDAALAAVAAERERMNQHAVTLAETARQVEIERFGEILSAAREDAAREGCPEAAHWLADLARKIEADQGITLS